jgi:magnesium-protoporphyrin O-methyltransferase
VTRDCCGFCASVGRHFDTTVAQGDLDRYRRMGPNATTRLMRDGILSSGGAGTVLDVGAGIGALSFELLAAGFSGATAVDAAPAYGAAARQEAARLNRLSQFEVAEGDYVAMAPSLPPADVVALDRVVCCYAAYEPLLQAAVRNSRSLLALSYPRARWYVHLVMALQNAWRRVVGNSFRTFIHPPGSMETLIQGLGFRRASRRSTVVWCVDVYARG